MSRDSDPERTIESVADQIVQPSLERMEAMLQFLTNDSRKTSGAIASLQQKSNKITSHIN